MASGVCPHPLKIHPPDTADLSTWLGYDITHRVTTPPYLTAAGVKNCFERIN